jgi:signal transduction histidine kinase
VKRILETAVLIKDSCHVALNTLSEVLTFDKIDENLMAVDLKPVDPWLLINEAVKPIMLYANHSKIKVTMENTIQNSRFHLIKADQFKMNQVIQNVLVNAIKFTPSNGEVKVHLGLVSVSDKSCAINCSIKNTMSNNSFVRITISDNGCGIPKEVQSKLFGKYVQFNSNIQEGKGAGLGLWISKSKLKTSNYLFYHFLMVLRYC